MRGRAGGRELIPGARTKGALRRGAVRAGAGVLVAAGLIATPGSPPAARAAPAPSDWTIDSLPGTFMHPTALAVDPAGTVFVADAGADVVWALAPDGSMARVAGAGGPGFSGDGGPAPAAHLADPRGLALDGAGDLFIADYGNDRVREVSASTGVITTVAGTGAWGSAPDGTPAAAAPLEGPSGVAVTSAGDVLFSETSAARVRMVSAAGGTLVTVAGTGAYGSGGDGGPAPAAQLAAPTALALDQAGRLLITDPGADRIRAVSPAGVISTVAGNGRPAEAGDGGPGPAASLAVPTGVAADPAGDVFVSEASGQRVREVAAATGVVFTAAGSGGPGLSGDGGPAPSASLHDPEAVAVEPSGDVVVADAGNHRLRRFHPPDPQGCVSRLPVGAARAVAAGPDDGGYALAAADGAVAAFGSLACQGSELGAPLSGPVAAMARAPGGGGYWLATADGSVYAFGSARGFGPDAPLRPGAPIVGMAATPDGGGYWLVSAAGGVFSFGDARFLGAAADMRLVRPVVGMAATPDGGGYWLVASDGGIFTYGDARFLGSTGAIRLARPIVGMAATPDGGGYWLVASDGGIFTYGDARFLGSGAATAHANPIIGMAGTPDGGGYWLVSDAGGVMQFGDAVFAGAAA